MEAFTTLPVTNCGPKILLPPPLLQLSSLRPSPPSPLPLLLPPPSPPSPLPLLPNPPPSPHLSMLPQPSNPPPPSLPTLTPHPKPHLTRQKVQLERLSTLLSNYIFLRFTRIVTKC